MPHDVFLLSPARCSGKRADLVYNARARFELAVKLRTPQGATLGDTFSFLSGLYFRGKLAYARAFTAHAYVITTNRGLVSPDDFITLADLRAMADCNIDATDPRYRGPLERDITNLLNRAKRDTRFILLGSIASKKYVEILVSVLGDRLLFPTEFVGRGDMSRGGLMLRHAENRKLLTYVPVQGAIRHGVRPPKLQPRFPGIAQFR